MRPENGSIVEVFEWKSSEAINQAHENVAVQALWAEFSEVCDYTPLAQLKETYAMFAEFDALEPWRRYNQQAGVLSINNWRVKGKGEGEKVDMPLPLYPLPFTQSQPVSLSLTQY